jgi:hypothetical protein
LIRRVVAGVVVTFAVAMSVSSAPEPAVALQPALLGNVEPALPASLPSTVAVVANSAPVGPNVGVIVRNGTAKAVDHVKVTGTASAPGGGMVARARTDTLVPDTLAPDALGIANLKFGKADLPSGTTFTFKVRSTRAPAKSNDPALEVREALLSRPMEGPIAQQMAVTVANLGAKSYTGPVTVTVMCFGEARNPAFVASTNVKKAKVASGATTPMTVPLSLLCPKYMVGASPG